MLALPILIKYMTKNASSGDGALSLLGALSQHKNNNSMDLQLKDADEDDGPRSSITFSAKRKTRSHRICPRRPVWVLTRSTRFFPLWLPAS